MSTAPEAANSILQDDGSLELEAFESLVQAVSHREKDPDALAEYLDADSEIKRAWQDFEKSLKLGEKIVFSPKQRRCPSTRPAGRICEEKRHS